MNRETPRVDEDALNALARVESPDELTELLASLPVEAAALAVRRAPELERKTEILWALEDRQRRQVLEQLPTTLIAALVQNLEDDNRYLLGDLSAERFDELLSLCSPERRYYWLSTAVSFTDARANVLPLLQDPKELAEALLTRPEFEVHVRAVADHPIERERVPPDLMDDPLAALVELVGASRAWNACCRTSWTSTPTATSTWSARPSRSRTTPKTIRKNGRISPSARC
jgi:DNA-binding transcriptional ArsR family regulator